jgi:hypothetical protein
MEAPKATAGTQDAIGLHFVPGVARQPGRADCEFDLHWHLNREDV